jgi:DNA-binding NarL/FixJ family response regulator
MMRVVVADDYAVVRTSIRAELQAAGIEVVGEAADGEEALSLVERLRPDVLVLDMEMPKLNGVEVARRLRKRGEQRGFGPRILVLSAYNNPAHILELLEAGAIGYVLKDEALETIVLAVQAAAHGHPWFSPSIAGKILLAPIPPTLPYNPVSPRPNTPPYPINMD